MLPRTAGTSTWRKGSNIGFGDVGSPRCTRRAMIPDNIAATAPLISLALKSGVRPENQQHQTKATTVTPCNVGYAIPKARLFASWWSIVRLLMAFAIGLLNQSG